jgi:hypothetical protein
VLDDGKANNAKMLGESPQIDDGILVIFTTPHNNSKTAAARK